MDFPDNSTSLSGRIRMKRFGLWLVPLIWFLPAQCPAATIAWDSFTVTVFEPAGSPSGAIVDVANLHWTSISPVPTSAQLQDFSYGTTFYFFTGVQQSSDGTVVPNEQAFATLDPMIATHILNAYQAGNLYIGLYNESEFLAGIHADRTNSKLNIVTPEAALLWPTALALAFLLTMRRAISYGSRR